MKTIKLFIWFAKHSWPYMQGQRREFFTGFIFAWINFYRLNKKGAKSGDVGK